MFARTTRMLAGTAVVAGLVWMTAARTGVTAAVPDEGPVLQSIGPMTFGPGGVLFAADTTGATIYALDLGEQAAGGKDGAADVAGIDQKIAAMLGTDAASVRVTDLVIHPKTHNAYISVMRGTGADAKPALMRVDGAGTIAPIAVDKLKYTKVALSNAPTPGTDGRRNPRADSITDMAYVDGKLIVAGLSNEEFASKLWSVPYPFTTADRGTSVEIYHGNHGGFETRAPVMTFLPYRVGTEAMIVAAYTCTPLVKFGLDALKPGQKVVGHTMMDLGAGNQPIDMIQYTKSGQGYLLMANSSFGVIKVPTAQFATAPAITAKVDTAGSFERIASMTGVQQLDALDAQRSVAVTSATDGSRSLTITALP